MTPSGVLPVLYCSQYDVGRPLGFVVHNGGEAVDLSTYTCTIEATRTDGTAITAAVTTDGNVVVFATTATMTNKMDKYPAKLVIVDGGGNRVASLAFVMCVTPATMNENAESIEEDQSLYQQYTGTVQTLIATERQQRQSADSALQSNINAEASARAAGDTNLSAAINAEASTRAAQDALLQTEINQLIAPSGEAPSAAEVQNARIGADGITYTTLGDAIRKQVTNITDDLAQSVVIATKTDLSTGYMYAVPNAGGLVGRNISEIRQANANTVYTETLIDVSAYRPYCVKITKNTIASSSTRGMGFCNSAGVITSWVRERDVFTINPNTGKYEGYLDITDNYLWLSLAASGLTELTIEVVYFSTKETVDKNNCVFVSPSGYDVNDGTLEFPFASVNRALKQSNNICILPGVYRQAIDLSNSYGGTVRLLSYDPTGLVQFEPRDTQLCTTAEAESGYTKVKKASVTATFESGNKWIFQEGVADATTLISDSERLPLQRGYEYRCPDTKIELCTSTTLSDALNEIEASTDYMWFYDATNHILYFSCPAAVSTSNPIKASFGHTLFSNATRRHTLILCGIEARYMAINVSETTQSEVIDCKASNVFGAGAFVYDRVLGGKFVRCEASRCFYGNNGDGFNGHSSNTGNRYAKKTTIHLVDCWSHDNFDDGYSDHERSETSIVGGLYEYNGKAGVTPSYGSHCTCYNVYSRHNNHGFYYTGTAEEAEGGKYGQMLCYGCVAEANDKVDNGSGFNVDGVGNTALCVNCKSIANQYAYRAGYNDNYLTIIDCGALNNLKGEKAGRVQNILAKNTTIVS